MSTHKHTKGPWMVPPDGYRVLALVNGAYVHVATTGHNVRQRTPEAQANAKLIAAAPEILEACELAETELALLEEMFPKGEDRAKSLTAIRLALSKAR